MKLLLRGGRVVDPSQDLDEKLDVLLEHGVIARLDPYIEPSTHGEVIEADGLVVAPGLIDFHVHLREPGQEAKETVATGVSAAVAGGFTAVVCMPNTAPPNDSRLVTEAILRAAERASLARVYPIGAISKRLEGEELAPYGQLAEAGCPGVSDDGRPVRNSELMRRALQYSQHFNLVVIQHAEDLDLSGEGVMHEGTWSAASGLPGIPGLSEDIVVDRDLLLLEETGGRYHVAHLSTRRSLELVRAAKARGLAVTCEVTPHHLLLTDRNVVESGFDSRFKMKPPLRSESDVQALLGGLVDGSIDCIASDHAPHTTDEKRLEFQSAPFGVVGLETTLSVCLDRLVHAGKLSLSRLIHLLSTGPARILGLPGGTLRPGAPADVTLIDLERVVTIDPALFRSKGRASPFAGWTLRGSAVATIVGGRKVFETVR